MSSRKRNFSEENLEKIQTGNQIVISKLGSGAQIEISKLGSGASSNLVGFPRVSFDEDK